MRSGYIKAVDKFVNPYSSAVRLCYLRGYVISVGHQTAEEEIAVSNPSRTVDQVIEMTDEIRLAVLILVG